MNAIAKQLQDTVKVRLWALRNVPMLGWVRPRIVELTEDVAVVRIPLNRRTKNHLNSMYFGVLACGADTAGGLLAMRQIENSGEAISLVFKDFKADFLKRPEADTVFTCRDGNVVKKMIREVIDTKERVSRTVHVVATCPEKLGSEPVANFALTLSLKKKG